MDSDLAVVDNPQNGDAVHPDYVSRDTTPVKQADSATTLPILPVGERPFFPRQGVALMLDESLWQDTIETVKKTSGTLLGIVMVKGASADETHLSDFHACGTVARVGKVSVVDGHIQFTAEGVRRFRIRKWLSSHSPFMAQVNFAEPPQANPDKVPAYGPVINDTIQELLGFRTKHARELKTFIARFNPHDSESFADFAANILTKDKYDLQNVLAPDVLFSMHTGEQTEM